MTSFDALADDYAAGRIGYSNELYDTLVSFGLVAGSRVLDVACGTGLASRPLIESGFDVAGVDLSEPMLAKARERFAQATWVAGAAESLPFADRSFDAAIGAQAFHHVDGARAIAELVRVLRPNGIVAIWWKLLLFADPVKMLRDRTARDLGFDPPKSGLGRGFKEFYGAPLRDHTLRVVPWATAVPLDTFLRYERSRRSVRDTFGARAPEYLEVLERRLHEQFGAGTPWLPLNYSQMLYMARTPG